MAANCGLIKTEHAGRVEAFKTVDKFLFLDSSHLWARERHCNVSSWYNEISSVRQGKTILQRGRFSIFVAVFQSILLGFCTN